MAIKYSRQFMMFKHSPDMQVVSAVHDRSADAPGADPGIGGKVVGRLSVYPHKSNNKMNTDPGNEYHPQGTLFTHHYTAPTISVAQVDDDYQRTGIATQMLAHAQQHEGLHTIQHSDEISGPAYAWAKATGGKTQTGGSTGDTWSVSDLESLKPGETFTEPHELPTLPPAKRGVPRLGRFDRRIDRSTQLGLGI